MVVILFKYHPHFFCAIFKRLLQGTNKMRFITGFFQLCIFIVLLGFALKNAQPVTVYYFFGYEWQSTLVIVMLLFFSVGVGLGILATLGIWFRQRREISRLKREISNIKKISVKNEEVAKPLI